MSEQVREEIRTAQSADKQELRKAAEEFASLIKHPGWARYLAILEQVGQNFHTTVMTPLGNSLESVKVEFAKGALTGLSLAASLPSAKIREANELAPDTDK